MIQNLDRRGVFGDMNRNQIRENFQGFIDEIMDKIGGERGGGRVEAEQGELNIGVTLRRDHVSDWVDEMKLFLEVRKFITMALSRVD